MNKVCAFCNKFMISESENEENNINETFCEQCADILEKYKNIIEPFGNGRCISFDSFIHVAGLDICPECGSDSKYYAKKNVNGIMVYKCINNDCGDTNYINLDIKEMEKAVSNNEPKKRTRKTQGRIGESYAG